MLPFSLLMRQAFAVLSAVFLAVFLSVTAHAAPVTKADLKIARIVVDAAKKADYDAAWAAVEKVKSDQARKALRWFLLSDAKSGAAFADITGFVLDNPGWPGIATLRRNAAKALTGETPGAAIAVWYKRFGPITGKGWQAYARALRETGAGATVTPLLRTAWRRVPMSTRDQIDFLRSHAGTLTPQDHAARLRMLLSRRWGRRQAARLMRSVPLPEAEKPALRLRLLLQRRSAAAAEIDPALAQLTEAQRQREGFLLDEIRWLRRQGRLKDAVARLAHAPDMPKHRRRWLIARTALAYALLKDKQNQAAYAAVAGHRQPDGYGRARSEFVAGWIALRLLKKPEIARKHFETLFTTSKFSISKARGAYWIAETEAAAGKRKAARIWLLKAASYRLTFYGQLALARLGGRWLVLPRHRWVAWKAKAALAKEDFAVAAQLFSKLGERKAARAFLWRLLNSAKDAPRMAAVSDFARRVGHGAVGVRAARRALMRLHPAMRTGYPRLRFARHRRVERALIHAIIRQESEFDPRAVSRSNARGLMQLLPSTARQMARVTRQPYGYARLTEDPRFNISLGSAYLDYLLKRWRGDYVLTIASYNAGPNRVKKWVAANGDPRDKTVNLVDWLELIPVGETRNYVQRVLENLAVYRAMWRRESMGREPRKIWRSRRHR